MYFPNNFTVEYFNIKSIKIKLKISNRGILIAIKFLLKSIMQTDNASDINTCTCTSDNDINCMDY